MSKTQLDQVITKLTLVETYKGKKPKGKQLSRGEVAETVMNTVDLMIADPVAFGVLWQAGLRRLSKKKVKKVVEYMRPKMVTTLISGGTNLTKLEKPVKSQGFLKYKGVSGKKTVVKKRLR